MNPWNDHVVSAEPNLFLRVQNQISISKGCGDMELVHCGYYTGLESPKKRSLEEM